MESSRDDLLIAALSAMRPAPRPAFAAELDERAAAGFPRRSGPGQSALHRFVARLRAMPPRRALLPACGVALAVIAVATVVVGTTGSGTGSEDRRFAATISSKGSAEAHNEKFSAPAHLAPNRLNGYQPPRSPGKNFDGAGPAVSGAALSGETSAAAEAQIRPFSSSADTNAGFSLKSGPYAPQANHRDVERSAQMVLGADPAQVSDDAAKVFDAVHAHDGIVLESSVHDGSGEFGPGANFDLLIPSAKLGDALSAISQIAEVRYRREATNDITAPAVGASERLQDSNAKVEGLLAQLAGAESDGEREAVEAQLQTERRHAAYLRSQLTMLQRRAHFSRVSLQIKTGDASPSSSSSDGGWSIGDALHDGGHILAIAAGVTIVGLAILAPIALLALLIWLANRTRIRRERERALS
jgi:hypothetical protein